MDNEEDKYDRDLLLRIASTNEAAMQEFFNRHNATVYAFAVRRLNEAADAADVVNEVMLQVWQKADTFEGRSKVKTWLLSITNFKIIDLLRKKGRHEHEELEEQFIDDSSDNGLSDIARAQDASAIKDCMDKLSGMHKQVVHLTFFEELSYQEISAVLECPAGTVKTRMMHAKNNLKRCLENIMRL